jgi:sensor histidine kinase YesM
LVTTTALMILLFFILKWIKRIRKNENEKLQTQKRLSELEQLAFRAQMNPHFIFNCLNSIQQYIFSKNELDANRFITDFASLIRQTMDLSVNKVISLEEEIRYLTTYLKLEHTRFEENFDYKISADADINQESVYLPSMFLQPL